MTSVVTIVLAAGRGKRIGGPKALLAWLLLPQKWVVPLAAAHVEARHESAEVVVVTRADIAAKLREHAAMSFSGGARGRLLLSEADDALGPAGSLAAAAAVLELDDDTLLLLTPVDCPPAQPKTVQALLAALADPTRVAAKPRCAGRGGHPIAARASLLARYRKASEPLRDVLRSLGEQLVEVAVDDPTIHLDIDDADALAAWTRKHGGGAFDEPTFFD
jgi:CTP:molybdopterin cytidylyltransferase MocA